MSGRCDRFASLVPRPARRQRCVMRISTWKRSTSGDARLVGETASSRASREPGAPLAAQVSESGPGGLCLRLDAKFPAEHELELVVLNELDEAARDGVLADSMLTLPPFRPRSRAISGSVPPMPRPLRRATGARWRRSEPRQIERHHLAEELRLRREPRLPRLRSPEGHRRHLPRHHLGIHHRLVHAPLLARRDRGRAGTPAPGKIVSPGGRYLLAHARSREPAARKNPALSRHRTGASMRPRSGAHGPQAGDNHGVTFERTTSTGEGTCSTGVGTFSWPRSVRSGR